MAATIEKNADPRTPFQILASAVLRCGPMPKHVAFIMDGNRRYARKLGQPVFKGHEKGYNVLVDLISWAVALRIPMITVYAFSIENFKRTPKEIEDLFSLLQNTLDTLAGLENNDLKAKGVRAQVIGNWDLIPESIKPVIGKLHLHAREATDSILTVNVALAYTGRDTIYRSYKAIQEDPNYLTPCDITEPLFEELHSVFPVPSVDLFIRTGGDTRLSDFMLWESAYAHIEFLEVTWPEFKFWDFWKAIFRFQATPRLQDPRTGKTLRKKQLQFVEMHRDKMWKEMELAAESYVEPAAAGKVVMLKRNWFKNILTALIDF